MPLALGLPLLVELVHRGREPNQEQAGTQMKTILIMTEFRQRIAVLALLSFLALC